jgi:thiamine biosynthesis protein ThiI
LGQVASQTLENLSVVGSATALPILRPLLAMDKEEIMAEARHFETYDISIRQHDDCCSLFSPEYPELRARLADAENAERQIGRLTELENEALEKMDKDIATC